MKINAHALYPSDYSFKLDLNDLSQIAADKYQEHKDNLHQKVYDVLAILWKPSECAAYYGARIIEPLPGENKGSALWSSAVRVYAVVLAVGFGVVALAIMPVVLPLHLWNHTYRDSVHFMCGHSSGPVAQGAEHLRTHNVALGPESFVVLTDLRPNKQRAQELVDSILEDPKAPQFMVLQEAYNQIEELTRLKEKYPYILHSIAPDAFGTSSGFFVASQHPIEGVEFRRLEMEQPEKYICRGALKVRIRTPQGLLDTYSVHLQALLGKDRAQRRLEQIQAMKEWMQSDYRMGQVDQVFIGDFNTSPLTAWGEDNDDPQQPEWKVLEYLRTHFFDCYGVQHNVRSGERLALAPEPLFLAHDNARMGTNLAEPVASLCQGPFLAKGWFLTTKNKRDRKKHKYPDPRVVKPLDKTTPWGSANWNLGQKENHARLDHAMIPNYCSKSFSSIVAEIRRTPIPPDRQSAVSDHLALDLVFKRKIT